MKKVAHELSFGAPNLGDDGGGDWGSQWYVNLRLRRRCVIRIHSQPWTNDTRIVLSTDHSQSGTPHSVLQVIVPLLSVYLQLPQALTLVARDRAGMAASLLGATGGRV